jgi:hypothetical protein
MNVSTLLDLEFGKCFANRTSQRPCVPGLSAIGMAFPIAGRAGSQ